MIDLNKGDAQALFWLDFKGVKSEKDGGDLWRDVFAVYNYLKRG